MTRNCKITASLLLQRSEIMSAEDWKSIHDLASNSKFGIDVALGGVEINNKASEVSFDPTMKFYYTKDNNWISFAKTDLGYFATLSVVMRTSEGPEPFNLVPNYIFYLGRELPEEFVNLRSRVFTDDTLMTKIYNSLFSNSKYRFAYMTSFSNSLCRK